MSCYKWGEITTFINVQLFLRKNVKLSLSFDPKKWAFATKKLLFLLLQTHLCRYGALPCYFMPLRVGQTSFGTQTTPSPPKIFWWPLQLNIKNPLFYFQKPIFSKNSLCQTQFLNKNVILMLENHLIRSTCLTIAKSTPNMVEKHLFHQFLLKKKGIFHDLTTDQ